MRRVLVYSEPDTNIFTNIILLNYFIIEIRNIYCLLTADGFPYNLKKGADNFHMKFIMSRGMDSKVFNGKKAGKRIKIIFLTVLFSVTCLCGCDIIKTDKDPIDDNPMDGNITGTHRDTPLTREEIEAYVRKTYFNEDGTAKREIWESKVPSSDYPYEYEDITGFEVEFIKGINGEKHFYLVEFEPTGFFWGNIHYEPDSPNGVYGAFTYRQSPFKILNIDKEERYLCNALFPFHYMATKIDGVYVDIVEVAWAGKYYPGLEENFNAEESLYEVWIYDEETFWTRKVYEKIGDNYVERKEFS